MTHNKFVEFFFDKYKTLLSSVIRKYLIPNRYNTDDVKQYIAEKILHILNSRAEDNKIKDPEMYFKSCLDFYCIEYQRMHGYIFELPKRPRKNCQEDESSARALGFKYIGDLTIDETNALLMSDEYLEYTPASIEFDIANRPVWAALTGLLCVEEANVIECIYLKNMTWAETSSYLNVAQSTCWFRKSRALNKLYNAFDSMSGASTTNNIKRVLRNNPDSIDDLQS